MNSEVRETYVAYNKWAAKYDDDQNATRDLDATVLQHQNFHLDAKDVVEYGSGTGKNTHWIAQRCRSLIALDFSEKMIEKAKLKVTSHNVTFMRHNILETWPIESNSRDFVIGNLVLEHICFLYPIFHEAHRVLRPESYMYLCELHPTRQMRGSQAHFLDETTGEEIQIPSFIHTIEEYVLVGKEVGLTVQKIEAWSDENGCRDTPRLLSILFQKR